MSARDTIPPGRAASPQSIARAAGVCWLLTIVAGTFAILLRGGAATAANVLATGFYAAATVFVYRLLAPVSKSVSLLALLFSFAGCTLSVLAAAKLAPAGVNPLVLFGLHCLLVGVLIIRSPFLPRIIGALMVLAGAGWLTFLSPELAKSLTPFNMMPGILGEVTLSLWLLVKGVDVLEWEARAAARP